MDKKPQEKVKGKGIYHLYMALSNFFLKMYLSNWDHGNNLLLRLYLIMASWKDKIYLILLSASSAHNSGGHIVYVKEILLFNWCMRMHHDYFLSK